MADASEMATVELWEEAEREDQFWVEHRAEFVEKYPEQFVAVREGCVVAVAPHLRGVERQLEEQGLKPGDVWLQFMTSHRRRLILC